MYPPVTLFWKIQFQEHDLQKDHRTKFLQKFPQKNKTLNNNLNNYRRVEFEGRKKLWTAGGGVAKNNVSGATERA